MELIDREKLKIEVRKKYDSLLDRVDINSIINGMPAVEEISKADYENRLKADMVAMLTEIQMEIEELQGKYSPYYDEASKNISWVIQEKINELKGDQDED